jgi:hypothetical protein
MSLSIASIIQPMASLTSSSLGGAVLEKSLDTQRQTGEEAIDLIQSAAQVGNSSGRLLSVYA